MGICSTWRPFELAFGVGVRLAAILSPMRGEEDVTLNPEY